MLYGLLHCSYVDVRGEQKISTPGDVAPVFATVAGLGETKDYPGGLAPFSLPTTKSPALLPSATLERASGPLINSI